MGDCAGTIHLPTAREIAADAATPDEAAVEAEPELARNQRNYRIADEDRIGSGSLKQKCRHNLVAIELLKQLEDEGRPATQAEKRVLVRYVG